MWILEKHTFRDELGCFFDWKTIKALVQICSMLLKICSAKDLTQLKSDILVMKQEI